MGGAQRTVAVVLVVTLVISGTGLVASASARTNTAAPVGPEVLGTADIPYPFTDDMEAGPGNWVAEPSDVWTLITPDSAHSGSKAWTVSRRRPGDNLLGYTT